MEALRFIPNPGSISLEKDVPKPQIVNDEDVIVEVQFAGLCGTDIHIVQVNTE